MNPASVMIIFLVIFLVLGILFRVPVGFSIGISAFVLMLATGNNLSAYNSTLFTTINSIALTAVPFYIFAGALMQHSGIADSMVNMVQAWLGRIKGSLGAVTIATSLAFGVLTGSTAATITAIGGILIEPMSKRGYPRKYSGALVSACGFLGVLIPPSIQGILFASVAGLRVSDVWLCTIGPGILVASSYLIINAIKRRNELADNTPFEFTTYIKTAGKMTGRAFWALLMPIIIFGGIYGGIMTATEAGAVSVLYGLIFFMVKRYCTKTGKKEITVPLHRIIVNSAGSTAAIALILYFSGAASRLISLTGVADWLTEFMLSHVNSATGFLTISTVLLLIAGCFLDNTVSIQIFTPLLMPSVLAYDINTSHFAAICLLALSVGQLTPPFAGSLFVGAKVANVTFGELVSEIWPFILAACIALLATVYIPAISLIFVAG